MMWRESCDKAGKASGKEGKGMGNNRRRAISCFARFQPYIALLNYTAQKLFVADHA